jgi:16S rRNA (cytidine1402-2'-O)-methyltransferase
MKSKVYLIPSLLDDEAVETIPPYVIEAVKDCQVFFVENERTARRFLKKIWKEIVIDNYEWFVIDHSAQSAFKQKVNEGKNIGIISEAGCPGIADPGQELIAIAQQMNLQVKPLVGPGSILLALMASGMNGQHFRFAGYLPIDEHDRMKAIKELETESGKSSCTQIFIETPYRNNQLFESVLKKCKPATKLCIAVDLTGKNEWIKTKTIADWSKGLSKGVVSDLSEKKEKIDIHKRPAIFLLLAE